MSNHSFQHLLSSPHPPPTLYPQYPSCTPPQISENHNPHGHYPPTSHRMDVAYSGPPPLANLRANSTQSFIPRFPTLHREHPASLPPRAGVSNHQPLPGLFGGSRLAGSGRYTTEGVHVIQSTSSLSNDYGSLALHGQRVPSEPHHGPLKWQEPVICTNTDASRLYSPVPILLPHPLTPPPTQNSGRSYGPTHDHRVVSILNGDVDSTLSCPVPRRALPSLSLFHEISPALAAPAGHHLHRPPIPPPGPRSVPPPGRLVPPPGPRSVPPPGPRSVPLPGPRSVPPTGPRSVPLPGPRSVPSPGPHSVPPLGPHLILSPDHPPTLSPGPSPILSPGLPLIPSPNPIPSPGPSPPSPPLIPPPGCPPIRNVSASNLGVSEKSLAKATSTLRNKLLNESISRFHAEQEERIGEIAEAHGVSFNRVKKLAGTSKHHRKRRINSAQDAILHAKTKELNEGRRHKAKISEIRRAAELDNDLQDAKADPEKLKILMDELEEHQQAKKDVARASNKVGAMRVTRLLQSFNSDELRGATDVAGFGFFVRGTFESSIKPTVIGGGPVHEFFQQYFKKDPWEMACLFEAFVTTYNKVGNRKLLHSEKAKATGKTILDSLARITGVDNIRMNYPNFRTKISAKYKVKIVGWPTDVDLMSPRDIIDPAKLDAVYDAWRSGSAYWSIMDKREYKKFMAQLEKDKAAGVQVEVPRKVRSDRGGTHEKASTKRQHANNGDEPAAKRRRASQPTKGRMDAEQETSDEEGNNKELGKDDDDDESDDSQGLEHENEDIDELDN
ncbi:hypothetical protein F5879DRAFT_995137 [Lentinula edodes]|nr:hypothetical protein F5879DRAFT_995137 [Lentinula edodes]